MNHERHESLDVETRLGRVTPRLAPEILRRTVLASVAAELSCEPRESGEAPVSRPPNRERRLACAAASLLMAAVVFNVFVSRSGEARLAKLFESSAPRGIVARPGPLESLAEQSPAQRLARQLLTMTAALTSRPNHDFPANQLQQLLTEWAFHGGDWIHAQSLEDTPTNRHRLGDPGRGALDDRRRAQLARELAA